ADGVLLVRRMETVAVRRSARLRPRRHRVLYADESDHDAMAGDKRCLRRLSYADSGMTTINAAHAEHTENQLLTPAAARFACCPLIVLFLALTTVRAQAPEPQTETVWSCPVHAIVNEQNPGKCPICRRDLVLVTATVTWTCADHPEIDRPVR